MANQRHRSRLKQGPVPPRAGPAFAIGVAGVALAALVWSYWSAIVQLNKDWQRSDNYSVGQLVPLVALYLLWHGRRALEKCDVSPCWWGIGLILVAQLARLYGLRFLYESAERYSLVLTIAGMVLLIAGRRVFWRARWILIFLFLMVPPPGRIHNMISGPLQRMATWGGVFLLEIFLFGAAVSREGITIVVNGIPLDVAEGCSGLRMLTAFIVVAATLACLVNRPRWQKTVLLLSSIPVAVACNIARLCVTAVLYCVASGETAQWFFHDAAGLAMMPLAVFILMGELWLMSKLVVTEQAPAIPTAKAKATVSTRGNSKSRSKVTADAR